MSKSSTQIKNAGLYMLPVIVSNTLPFITLPIFTRILSVEEYGAYGLALAYSYFINGIANFGLTVGYERNFFESKDKIKQAGLFYSTLGFVIIAFILFAFLTFAFKEQISSRLIGQADFGKLIFYTFCGISMINLKTYFLTFYKNTQNVKPFVLFSIIESILIALFSVYLVVILKIGIIGLGIGQLAAGGVVFSILLITFLTTLPFKIDLDLLKNSLKISLPLTPRIFFGVIGAQFDKYMIGLLASLGGVGEYSLAQRIGNISFTFTTALQNVFGPQVYQQMFDNKENGADSIGRYLTPYLYISILGGLFLALFSQELIILMTPIEFHGAIDIVSILCLLYGIYFFGKQPQLIYAKKSGLVSLLTLLRILLNIGINIPFIYFWGVIGAAWATLLAGVISSIISFNLAQKYYPINWQYDRLFAILLMFFSFVIAIILLRQYDVAYTILLSLKMLFVGIYIIYGNRIGLLNKRNFQLVKSSFRLPKI